MLRPAIFQELEGRLQLFTWIDNKAHFRCPVCGDSKKDPNKRRGGFIEMSPGSWLFSCLNCGVRWPFEKFLKWFDYELYKQHRFEALQETRNAGRITLNSRVIEEPEPEVIDSTDFDKSIFDGLERILDLDANHPAFVYLKNRQIPKTLVQDLYFTSDFNAHITKLLPSKDFSKKAKAAIVIPWIWKDGVEFGMQARYLEGQLRYKSISIDKQFPKVFGMHKVDVTKFIHVTEGVFDACYLPNNLAALDSALHKRCDQLHIPKEQFILWFDADCSYNAQLRKQRNQAIEEGYKIAFYPSDFLHYGKDINEVVLTLGFDKAKTLLNKSKFLTGIKAKMAALAETQR